MRLSWFVLLVVAAATLAVPALRQQLRLGLSDMRPSTLRQIEQNPEAAADPLLKPYRERAVGFVNQRYANDPEMLMAAAVLAQDDDLLKRAAAMGKSPVAWAAYVERLMQTAPGFARIGSSGVDPADAAAVRDEEQRIAESGEPTKLTPEQAEPVLSALRSWQEVDPENALPVALEARFLYGLHQDRDALAVWAQAGRMPEVRSHGLDRARAVARLLTAMGMPKPEAMVNAGASLLFPSYARLRDNARFAVYEGRLAAMGGDPSTAVTCWQSTIDFGQHMEDSADTLIGFFVASAIQGIGAGPVWQWVPDSRSGIPNGPLFDGRFFWGDRHSLYVEQMGERNDEELRDRLVLTRLRSQATRGHTADLGMFESYSHARRFLGFAAAASLVIAVLLATFLIFGSWSRRPADEATRLHPLWQLLLAAVLLAAPIEAVILLSRQPPSEPQTEAAIAATLGAALAGFMLLVLAVPALAAVSSRAEGARLRTAWRGNLRRILPVMIALCAVTLLGLSAHAARLRSQWAEKWSAPGVTEMSELIRFLGDKWTNPTIPPDAWRAEYPPSRGAL
jgi:hypothetical protein